MKTAMMMLAGQMILRAPNEGNDAGESSAEMFDPLGLGDISLNDTDTSMPVIIPGNYVLSIKSVALVENSKKTGNNLLVIFETTTPATSLSGQARGLEGDINPGFQLRQYMPMQDNPDKPAYDFRQNLARLQDAVTGSKKGNRGPFLPSSYVGQLVIANVGASENEEMGGMQNNIKRLSHPA